jgi:hypothetical protein
MDARESPAGWVPVEHRWFGLDRRTFKPALIALAVALVLVYGLPALNAAIPWHREIIAGSVLDLGGGATAVPPVGWQLEDGSLVGGSGTGPASVRILLAKGGATITFSGAAFTGSAEAFLQQVHRAQRDDAAGVSGPRNTLTTDAGLVGVVRSSTSSSGDRLDAAFKMAVGTSDVTNVAPALLVRVRTAPGQFEQYREEVTTVLRSIKPGTGR